MNLEEQNIALKVARQFEKEGKLKIKTPFQIASIEGENKITGITIKKEDGKIEKISTDRFCPWFFWFNNEIRSNN